MMGTETELGQRTIRRMYRVIGEELDMMEAHADAAIAAAVGDHESRLHRPLPGPRRDMPTEIPWQEQTIPDRDLRRMVEDLERDGEQTVAGVALAYHYPLSLARREITRYLGANYRYERTLG